MIYSYMWGGSNQPSQAFQEINLEMKTTLMNCRFWHTYQDEDTVGSVKQIARMVHRRLLEVRLLGRWLIRLGSYRQGRTNQPLRSAARWKVMEQCGVDCGIATFPIIQGQRASKFHGICQSPGNQKSYMKIPKKVIYECRFWGSTEVTRAYGRKYFQHLWMSIIVAYAGCSGVVQSSTGTCFVRAL